MGKKAARRAAVEAGGAAVVDKHTLYAQAVQSPKGDIDYLCRFHAQYMPPGAQAPLLLREDFSGTSELCAAWCASDPRRQAVGVDLDADELRYAVDTVLAAKSSGSRTLLVHANVLDDPAGATPFNVDTWVGEGGDDGQPADWRALWQRKADIVAALNSSLCLLHTPQEARKYIAAARANTASPGLFVLDMNGGHSMEKELELKTRLRGFDYLWSQDGFDPLSRLIRCHISFRTRGPSPTTLRHAYSYTWRLWTLPEARDMLLGSGFSAVHIWMRRMREDGEHSSSDGEGSDQEGSGDESSQDDSDGSGSPRRREGKSRDEYVEVTAKGMTAQQRHRFARGWQAYIVAVNA